MFNKLIPAIFVTFFLLIILPAFITADDPIDKIAASLTNWTKNSPQEKVYLHMDKPYYSLGDTIWFKAYVTVGSRHQLSALSGALYVDLITEKDSVEKTIKLPVIAGTAKGDFILSDTLADGNYRIRAYTQWMRNAGSDYFFDRTFTVIKGFDNDVNAKVNYQYKITGNKPVVTAMLNYKDKDGNPFAEQEVNYEIVINKKIIESKKVKTDTRGDISIDIPNGEQPGGYIQTTIQTADKKRINNIFAIKAALSHSDIQFFPEGGSLVNGISSRVAFKAVGINGTGVAVKGVITDNTNREIASFKSAFAGIGRFNFIPEAGKSYTAKITYPDGSETRVDLPKSLDAGYVLAVYNDPESDTLLVRINAPAQLYQAAPMVNLVAQSGGEMLYASQVKINRPATSVYIPKKDFPTGIAQYTLFNNNGEPLNERIAFIRANDQMRIKINTARQSYKAREKVEIEAEADDSSGKPVVGSFSVSVIDESKVPVNETDESTILSNILLTADLKGYIEKPNYYFTKQNEEVNEALDNLMLTQGYRRFVWKDILTGQTATPRYKAEKVNTTISGKLLSLGNKPVPNGKVTLFSLKNNILLDTITDADGRFSFNKLILPDSVKFTVQGRTPKNGTHVQVIMDKASVQGMTLNKNIGDINTDITESKKEFIANSTRQAGQLQKLGKLNRVQQLKGVNIKGKKPQSQFAAQGMFTVPAGHADQTYVLENPENCSSLAMCLQGRLQGVTFSVYKNVMNWPFTNDGGSSVAMRVILNGQNIDNPDEASDILNGNTVDPMDVARIEVVRTSRAMISYLGGASLLIVTKNGVRSSYRPEIANVSPRGFNYVKEFYAPRYDSPKNDSQLADLRSTIYWNPNIKTTTEGKVKFDFFNADDKGTYKVVIEGINAAGELGRQVYRYKVE
ncbi:carboxypeptidase-like regulatory domain-containing protein [Mucilaginibacter pocheonensis]|uniref:TonB-dependent Receptor Plug Domain n=1 Tax=Mucilaginibacter pocheonensis TaxID=398050 RepID=A0ABU1T7T3_9SPHI|nr:carboxypeptidase-like regulatory domain-containing protein [Mucilaginibacter pocheonensis]MDR6941429.1 hypothetical protein [Mucilaginibacter pocheonensis]